MAAPGSNNNTYHLKFKQPTTINGRTFFYVPDNNENNENDENDENRQYAKYERYMERLKGSMKQLNERLRGEILRNEEIVTAPDGIYTWIIKNDTLYAIRVFTQQEIGTLHLDLDRHTRHEEGDITSAGELKVSSHAEPTIEFNLQSGTYTAKIITFHLDADIADLFTMPDSALFIDVQKDAKEITDVIKQYVVPIPPKDRGIVNKLKFTEDEIKMLLRKRLPEEIKPIQQRIKNRIILYKRDRMVETVREKICSFFPDPDCSVQFRKSGSDEQFIETGDAGHEFEVTAGKSLLAHEPIISTQANLHRLQGLFKEGKIRKYMTLKRRYQPPIHHKPKLNNNKNNNKTSKAKKPRK